MKTLILPFLPYGSTSCDSETTCGPPSHVSIGLNQIDWWSHISACCLMQPHGKEVQVKLKIWGGVYRGVMQRNARFTNVSIYGPRKGFVDKTMWSSGPEVPLVPLHMSYRYPEDSQISQCFTIWCQCLSQFFSTSRCRTSRIEGVSLLVKVIVTNKHNDDVPVILFATSESYERDSRGRRKEEDEPLKLICSIRSTRSVSLTRICNSEQCSSCLVFGGELNFLFQIPGSSTSIRGRTACPPHVFSRTYSRGKSRANAGSGREKEKVEVSQGMRNANINQWVSVSRKLRVTLFSRNVLGNQSDSRGSRNCCLFSFSYSYHRMKWKEEEEACSENRRENDGNQMKDPRDEWTTRSVAVISVTQSFTRFCQLTLCFLLL